MKNDIKSITGFIVAWLALFFCIYFLPTTNGFNESARAVLGITVWVIFIWISDAVPKGISGLMIPVLLIFMGVFSKPAQAFSGFTSNESFLCLGAFLMAAIMKVLGVDRRIALTILSRAGKKITSVINKFMIAHIITALFIPATVARASMYFPLVQGINAFIGNNDNNKNVRKALAMTAIGFGAVFSAPLFLTSHMPNIIIATLLNNNTNIDITWIKWFLLHWPMIGLFPLMLLWIKKYFKLNKTQTTYSSNIIQNEYKRLGKIGKNEIMSILVFFIAIVLWMMGSYTKLPSGIVAIFAVFLIFIPKMIDISWKEVQEHTIWGTWLLLAGALCLVNAFTKTGLDVFLAKQIVWLVPNWGAIAVVFFVACIVQILRIGIISNVGAVTLMAPIIFSMAPLLHLNAVSFTLAILDIDTFAMILPTEVTACLIAYASNEFSFWEFMKVGAPLTVISIIYVTCIMIPWWALCGYPIWSN